MPGGSRDGAVRELKPGLLMLDKTWGCNVYLLNDEDHPLLVDGGFPVDAGRVACLISRAVGTPTAVATHYHLDHEGSFARLKCHFPGRVAAHKDDADFMEGNTVYEVYKVDRFRTAYYKVLGPWLFPFEPVHVDIRLEDRQLISGVRVIHVPGHTPGSIMMLDERSGILFTGDSIRNEGGGLDGPPAQFSSEIEETYWHIREKVLDLEFDSLLPGHGEPLMRGAKKEVARMMWRQGRCLTR